MRNFVNSQTMDTVNWLNDQAQRFNAEITRTMFNDFDELANALNEYKDYAAACRKRLEKQRAYCCSKLSIAVIRILHEKFIWTVQGERISLVRVRMDKESMLPIPEEIDKIRRKRYVEILVFLAKKNPKIEASDEYLGEKFANLMEDRHPEVDIKSVVVDLCYYLQLNSADANYLLLRVGNDGLNANSYSDQIDRFLLDVKGATLENKATLLEKVGIRDRRKKDEDHTKSGQTTTVYNELGKIIADENMPLEKKIKAYAKTLRAFKVIYDGFSETARKRLVHILILAAQNMGWKIDLAEAYITNQIKVGDNTSERRRKRYSIRDLQMSDYSKAVTGELLRIEGEENLERLYMAVCSGGPTSESDLFESEHVEFAYDIANDTLMYPVMGEDGNLYKASAKTLLEAMKGVVPVSKTDILFALYLLYQSENSRTPARDAYLHFSEAAKTILEKLYMPTFYPVNILEFTLASAIYSEHLRDLFEDITFTLPSAEKVRNTPYKEKKNKKAEKKLDGEECEEREEQESGKKLIQYDTFAGMENPEFFDCFQSEIAELLLKKKGNKKKILKALSERGLVEKIFLDLDEDTYQKVKKELLEKAGNKADQKKKENGSGDVQFENIGRSMFFEHFRSKIDEPLWQEAEKLVLDQFVNSGLSKEMFLALDENMCRSIRVKAFENAKETATTSIKEIIKTRGKYATVFPNVLILPYSKLEIREEDVLFRKIYTGNHAIYSELSKLAQKIYKIWADIGYDYIEVRFLPREPGIIVSTIRQVQNDGKGAAKYKYPAQRHFELNASAMLQQLLNDDDNSANSMLRGFFLPGLGENWTSLYDLVQKYQIGGISLTELLAKNTIWNKRVRRRAIMTVIVAMLLEQFGVSMVELERGTIERLTEEEPYQILVTAEPWFRINRLDRNAYIKKKEEHLGVDTKKDKESSQLEQHYDTAKTEKCENKFQKDKVISVENVYDQQDSEDVEEEEYTVGDEPTEEEILSVEQMETTDDSLKFFLNSIREFEVYNDTNPSEEQRRRQVALWQRVREGTESQKIEATKTLCEMNYRLVVAVVKNYLKGTSHPEVEFMDLVLDGYPALSKAISSYKPERGYNFSTYAYKIIKRAVVDGYIRQHYHNRVGPQLGRKILKVENWIKEYRDKNGIDPHVVEISEALGIRPDTVQEYLACINGRFSVKMDAPLGDMEDSDSRTIGSNIEDPSKDNYQVLLKKKFYEDRDPVMNQFTDREQMYIVLRDGYLWDSDGQSKRHTQAEIAELMGMYTPDGKPDILRVVRLDADVRRKRNHPDFKEWVNLFK